MWLQFKYIGLLNYLRLTSSMPDSYNIHKPQC